MAVILINKAAVTSALTWAHLTYVFGSVEAIVFTAVGWLFGREVHREAAAQATKAAKDATANAATTQVESKVHQTDAAAAMLRASKLEAAIEGATEVLRRESQSVELGDAKPASAASVGAPWPASDVALAILTRAL